MKGANVVPDRKALETGFLILALLPHRALTSASIRQASKRIKGLRMRILGETSYERRTGEDADDQGGLWRNYTSLEPPGMDFHADLVVPEYPLVEHRDVNRCDLRRMSDAVWHGMNQMRHKADSGAL